MTEYDMTSLIQVSGLEKTYKQGTIQTQALKNIGFTVHRGEYVGIVGKSGAGKTTGARAGAAAQSDSFFNLLS